MENRPRSRVKNVTGGSGVYRRGSGLGTGPVGSGGMFGGGSGGGGSRGGGGKKAGGLGGIGIVVALVVLIFKFCAGGGSGGTSAAGGGSAYQFAGGQGNGAQTSYSEVDDKVAKGARAKYTRLAGGGRDDVTLLVYMCGTDLESGHGMASADLAEMTKANIGRVNLLVYTGGCKKWKTSGISSTSNQIYKIEGGSIKRLEANAGKGAMTDPKTLASFIKWGASKYPATRYGLVLWDHGGGSVSGFGYDENNTSAGAMSLSGIDSALTSGGVKFDFVGFDACLMATAETALMLEKHADYMIASEETEPGIGWYYTNWLGELGRNPSEPTLSLGKRIADDFVAKCADRCPGQRTTLSVVDLAEAAKTIPGPLSAFADSLSRKIVANDYKSVSDARYRTREFAQSSKIDQVDLVDLCVNAGGNEARTLAEAVKGAVKYNRSNLTDAHGLSIFFPYRSTKGVDKACETYRRIGMDDSYSKCIREFAGLQACGQAAQGGTSGAMSSLLGSLAGAALDAAGGQAGGNVSSLIGAFLQNGGGGLVQGLTGANISFLTDRKLGKEDTAAYIGKNRLDRSALAWEQSGGRATLSMGEEQWKLVHELDKAMFYDDGSGYVDLGFDNVFSFDDQGRLVADTDRDWLALDGQVVAYYHLSTEEWRDGGREKYKITGRVPALLNGSRVNLIVAFTDERPLGFVAGAETDYRGATDVAAKGLSPLKKGDRLDFLCDYYTYGGSYNDTYYIGEQHTVSGDVAVSNVDVGSGSVKIAYRLTDIYDHEYWTPALTR